jgi:hypothetical protein
MDREQLISGIIALEWAMFQNTQNVGGRADCQDDWKTFEIMRASQAKIWADETLESYLRDLELAVERGENLIAYKYGYMMEHTYPEEYEQIKGMLPAPSPLKLSLVEEICAIHGGWTVEAHSKYPKLAARGRPISQEAAKGGRWAAIDSYLRGELLTYSERTLRLCLRDTKKAYEKGENLTLAILKNTAAAYGYGSLEALESALGGR